MDEALRQKWTSRVMSNETWETTGPSKTGEAGGLFVKSKESGELAYLKPLKNEPHHPRAAYEKIASDLANHFGLNVPPVSLHRRPNPDAGQPAQVALSLVFAENHFNWGELFQFNADDGGPVLAGSKALRVLLKSLMRRDGKVLALDAWLQNTDRHNVDNVIYASADEDDDNSVGGLYFLDFANSMDYNGGWTGGGHLVFSRVSVPKFFANCLKHSKVAKMADRIRDTSDGVVESIVTRIPDDFLSPEKRQKLVEWLVARKTQLPNQIGAWYPG